MAAALVAGLLHIGPCAIDTRARADTIVIDFEDISLDGAEYLDGTYSDPLLDDADPQGGGTGESRALPFVSRGAAFSNWYDRGWYSWTGFAITSVNDPVPSNPLYMNQYSAAAGPAFEGSNYAIAYLSSYGLDPVIDLPSGYNPTSVRLTNTTYVAAAIRDGMPGYSRAFGDDPTTPGVFETSYPDFFKLVFTGYDGANASGSSVGSVEFFLADYRFTEDALDFVVDAWTEVDLSSLAGARSLSLAWFSSDIGEFGMNTPTYVALDNLTVTAVPEPSAIVLVACGAAAGLVIRRRRHRAA